MDKWWTHTTAQVEQIWTCSKPYKQSCKHWEGKLYNEKLTMEIVINNGEEILKPIWQPLPGAILHPHQCMMCYDDNEWVEGEPKHEQEEYDRWASPIETHKDEENERTTHEPHVAQAVGRALRLNLTMMIKLMCIQLMFMMVKGEQRVIADMQYEGPRDTRSAQLGKRSRAQYTGDGPGGIEPEQDQHKENERHEPNAEMIEGRMGTIQQPSTARGDEKYKASLTQWAEPTMIHQLGEIAVSGHDLWYQQQEPLTWENLQGTVMALNMDGWGDIEDTNRINLFNQMAKSHTLIAILVDHRKMRSQQETIQNEMEAHWTGRGGDWRPMFITEGAKTNKVGGITIALHPTISRSFNPQKNSSKQGDPRGWGRWTSAKLTTKGANTLIVGTYGPSQSRGEKEGPTDAMWTTQKRMMEKLDKNERTADPAAQYIWDLG